MDWKKFTQATLASGVAMVLIAGLWHEILMAHFYANEVHAEHQGLGVIFLSYLSLAALMAYLYPLGHAGENPLRDGLRFGVIMGILWVMPHELAMAGAHGESISYVFKNAAWHAVEQGIGGVVISFVYRGLSMARLQPESAG